MNFATMKGSKAHSHNSSGKKAMPVSQAEPLFPRVHVNETRNGPKAPPRNKMALYEQLTVPSHHYLQTSSLQSSGSAWSPAYAPQYSPYAGNFAPWVVFSAADGVPTLASQKSAVMDSGAEKELQTVPRVAVPDDNCIRPSEITSAAAAPSSNVSSKDFSNKRARVEDDFAVPTYCFPKGGSGKAEPLIAMDGHGEPPGPTNETGAACQQSAEGYTQTGQAPGFFYPQREHTRQTSRGNPGTMGQVTERICSSESTGNLDNRNDDDFFETLHQEQIGDASNASILELDVNIAARDVIGAVGEQEFWKIRKNLLRQQHIFTLQIFELHRLIKVQQLLAQSRNLLLEADTDNVALAEPSQPGRIAAEETSEDCREVQAQALKRPDQKLKAINDVDVEKRHDNGGKSNHAAVRHETPSLPKCSSAAPLSLNSAGVPGMQYAVPNAFVGSANSWAYAPYPVNQWTMLPTSGAYPYVFQPSAPAPVGYNAAYQPVFRAPGGYEMFPMGQRQPDMSVYYQHALPPGHHWQPPVFCNSAIPSVPSPWYTFPQYYDAATMSSAPGHGPDINIHQQQQQQQQQYQHQQQQYQQQQQQYQQHQQQQQLQQQQQHQQQQQQHQQRQQHRDKEGESAFQRISKLPKEVPSSYSELSSERTGIVQQVQERDFPQGSHNTDRKEGGGDNNVRCAPSLPFSFSSPDERHVVGNQEHGKKVAPRPVMATLESAAGILKSIQRR